MVTDGYFAILWGSSQKRLVCLRGLLARFSSTGRIADAAEELPKTAAAFDQPAIFAVWARRIVGTATTSNLARPLGKAWQGRAAGWAGGQQVSAVLDMLTAIPDATILPGHAQQSPTTFAADVSFGFSAGGWSSLACVKHLTVSLRRGPLSGGFPVAAVFPVPWQEFG